MDRRNFIKKSSYGGVALSLGLHLAACRSINAVSGKINPISICTWGFVDANAAAGRALENGNNALDAAIKGVNVEEKDLKNTTVGNGAAPDREGNVTLDASVMDHQGNCGSVVYVQDIQNVASLAREVMDHSPHVMLAGDGAYQFAINRGFKKQNLLTDNSKNQYREWLKTSKYKPVINIENHDTIGVICRDINGNLSGACSTSGLAYKMPGRVGDSPIIGAGLYVDNEIGAAAATGLGEEIMKTVGSFLIVELMRNGKSPQEACEEAVKRTAKRAANPEDFQVAYIAMNKAGETGYYSLQQGFAMMEYSNGTNRRKESAYYLKT
ncbi:N(4)-(beta-N-acetylglucosaminyl)-L-asparaginase [Nonlabens ponticola]|uniref:Glycosylasparaginase n=1 Tax=Nonlabens ponticola TaxID=2496866 RepID=A0A3S9MUC5_9FLAO|nr:N(4)-(beta-N-acetylglucosaminyl)-L-asparaginase [Nonlabens ponticola]AZQ42775.1 glycosylasparaginase [Nonlabens ponticola]